ncbi:MAG: nucleotidyltransferase domain-containing protein [Thermofilum sp.]
MEVVRRRAAERRRVVEEARRWASSLSFKATAILVGSYARGDFNKWSDVDVLLITGELGGGPLERLRKVEAPPGYEVIVWTPEEFALLLKKGNPLALEAARSGVFLRDDYGLSSSPELRARSESPGSGSAKRVRSEA